MDGMDGGKHNSDNTETSTTKKKKYHIMQTQPAIQTWYFEVEAESEEEAIRLVEDGDVEVMDYEVHTDHYSGNFETEVVDVEDIKEGTK